MTLPASSALPAGLASTQWWEVIPDDEVQRFAAYAQQFAQLQARVSARQGTGRALHRKQLLGAKACFTVLPDLPDFARHGLFAVAGTYAARVRLSNGGIEKTSDAKPDIRGFAFAVDGLDGLQQASTFGGVAHSQGFALINHEVFAFPHVDEFVPFALAAARGPKGILQHLIQRHGVWAGTKRLLHMLSTIGKPFAGFANESFYSAAPIACGPYAVKVRLQPDADNGPALADARKDWGADMAQRLRQGDLGYTLSVQPFVDEARTPIENPSIAWPSAYVPVARLELPQQDITDAPAIEQGVFDPWVGLAAHRPLGNIMRARQVVYYQSQQTRGATT